MLSQTQAANCLAALLFFKLYASGSNVNSSKSPKPSKADTWSIQETRHDPHLCTFAMKVAIGLQPEGHFLRM